MTIVVDLGCYHWDEAYSLEALAVEYQPEMIYGFDPSPLLNTSVAELGGASIQLARAAAWLYNGEVSYLDKRMGSRAGAGDGLVPCLDFAAWLYDLGEPVVVKMDIEGGEYELLPRLVETGADYFIEELLLEWHRGADLDLQARLACPVWDWWM
jgi:hypothetical protein